MARRTLDEWFWQIGFDLRPLGEEITPGTPKVARSTKWEPRVDVLEYRRFLVVRSEIAGLRVEDLRVSFNLERHVLTIRGRRDEEPCEEAPEGCIQLEISYGEFERGIQLPRVPVRPDAIRGQYRNGFLTIYIPKLVASGGRLFHRRPHPADE